MAGLVIAVDGPSGSGKSSTARKVAQRLGLRYLDTGAMYRAVTWALLGDGVDVSSGDEVAAAAVGVSVQVGTDPGAPSILANGLDVSVPIRGPEVTAAVSTVSAVPEVRTMLVRLQREIIGTGGIVVEGRDIGSTVVPDAPVKVFLTADAATRAFRRNAELGGPEGAVAATEQDMARRDAYDSSRSASPLTRASDAVLLDTTELSPDEVVDHIVSLVRAVPVAAPDGVT